MGGVSEISIKKNSELRKLKKKCGGNGANKISVDTDINQFHSTK